MKTIASNAVRQIEALAVAESKTRSAQFSSELATLERFFSKWDSEDQAAKVSALTRQASHDTDSDPTGIRLAAKSFADECSKMVEEDYKQFTALVAQGFSRRVSIEFGRRYAKLISMDVRNGTESAHSVYCFVDLTNGDILKAATWKSPAKHARGNVLRSDRMSSVGPYGANYMR